MIAFSEQFIFFMEMLVFLSVIFMHLSKKNQSVVYLYVLQSLIIGLFLFSSAVKIMSLAMFFTVLVVFVVKIGVAPYFFHKLIKRHKLKFSVSTYLNGPLTLVALALITGFTYSHLFSPLAVISEHNDQAVLLSVATILISVFLIINRRGAMSQIVGILSLENAIVSFAYLAGLEEAPALQLGIIFDIFVWLIIATVFASMVYRQFGSLNVTAMTNLKEE